MTERSEWSAENEEKFEELIAEWDKHDTQGDWRNENAARMEQSARFFVMSYAKKLIKDNIWPPKTYKGRKSSYGVFDNIKNRMYHYFEVAEREMQLEELKKKMLEEQEEKERKAQEEAQKIQELKQNIPEEAKRYYNAIVSNRKKLTTLSNQNKEDMKQFSETRQQIYTLEKKLSDLQHKVLSEQRVISFTQDSLNEALEQWQSYEQHESWAEILSQNQLQWESMNRLLTLMQHVIES